MSSFQLKLCTLGMAEDLKNAAQGSVVLLHACAHNPTGVDPSLDQWRKISSICKEKNLLCFFDSAYQGFASGDPDRDAAAFRLFSNVRTTMLLTDSRADECRRVILLLSHSRMQRTLVSTVRSVA